MASKARESFIPRLLYGECPYCYRQFSRHFIRVHGKQCLTDAKLKQPTVTTRRPSTMTMEQSRVVTTYKNVLVILPQPTIEPEQPKDNQGKQPIWKLLKRNRSRDNLSPGKDIRILDSVRQTSPPKPAQTLKKVTGSPSKTLTAAPSSPTVTTSRDTAVSSRTPSPMKNSPKTTARNPIDKKQPLFVEDLTSEDPSRPTTMTISGGASSSSIVSKKPSGGPPPTRTCYVCGQQFSRNSLEFHEKKCRQFWRTQAESLPNFVKTKEPLKMEGVSVDGTVDDARREAYAQQSSRSAQTVTCEKCKKSVSIWNAKEHASVCRRGKKQNKKNAGPFVRYNQDIQSILY